MAYCIPTTLPTAAVTALIFDTFILFILHPPSHKQVHNQGVLHLNINTFAFCHRLLHRLGTQLTLFYLSKCVISPVQPRHSRLRSSSAPHREIKTDTLTRIHTYVQLFIANVNFLRSHSSVNPSLPLARSLAYCNSFAFITAFRTLNSAKI